jgi:hypothetical protein
VDVRCPAACAGGENRTPNQSPSLYSCAIERRKKASTWRIFSANSASLR